VTIRSHLLLLVAGALLPLLVFAVAITSFSWWQQRNAVELRYLERVRAMTVALDGELDGSIRAMRSLALSPDLDPAHMDEFIGAMRRAFGVQPLWSALAVGDAQWHDVAAVGRGVDDARRPAIDAAVLQQVSKSGLPSASGLVRAPDGRYETQVALPVLRDGALQYVLLVVIDQDHWLKFMSQYSTGNGTSMTLMDRDGIIIASTLENGRWVGKTPPPSLLENSRSMAEGAYRGPGVDGEMLYGAHSRSVRWGWTVATGIPARTVEAALLSSSAVLAAVAFVSIGVAILLAFLLGRRIQRPITALGDSARALATGDAITMPDPAGIDEVKQVEEAFSEAGAMLRERRQSLKEALEREQLARKQAEDASHAKDEFLAMLGHELRNPLNAIGNAVGVLNQTASPSEGAARPRQIIARQVASLRELVDDLLDVARVTSGKIVLNRKPIDLAAVVRSTVATLSSGGRLGRHRVDAVCESAWVAADETRVEQVVTNLLDNAAKYTPEGGTITVRVRSEAGNAVLEVADTGMGITPELLPRVFELFSQGERTLDRSQGGLGVGLALVRRLSEMHGGAVRASSAGAGQGATFTVSLPLIESPPEARAAPADDAQSARGLRIVLVEDNPDGRESLAMMLRIQGHEVHEADSGPSGVEQLAAVRPDVAIVDIGLPGFDGYEVARRTRASPAIHEVALVALTGYGQEEDRRRAAAAGFDWFLVKPADVAALAAILANLPGAAPV
jgi:signal transduction histidine kinase/ActR/RegA family two-component response regulator